MLRYKLALIYRLAILTTLILVAWLLWPGRAAAQGPDCIPSNGSTYYLQYYTDGSSNESVCLDCGPSDYGDNATGPPDGVYATLYVDADKYGRFAYSLDTVISGTITISPTFQVMDWLSDRKYLYTHPNIGASAADAGWVNQGNYADTSVTVDSKVGSVMYRGKAGVLRSHYYTIDTAQLTLVNGCAEINYCALVPNAHFTDTSDWLLTGSAAITNSNLTLTPGDQAAQNLSGLSSQTTYDVTIDVSQAVSTTSLAVVLGNDTDTLNITGSGTYTTQFTTPNLAGPVAYGFENTGTGSVDIDYACLALAATGPGGETQTTCLAPTNGDFSNNAGWDFYRGATWQEPAYNVNLPQPEQGLVKTSSAFSLPTLATGEYLLMSFTAQGNGGDAGIASRVNGSSAEVIFSSEVYAQPYIFEVNVSDVPNFGDTTADVAFANPGDEGLNGVFSDLGVVVDDICLFVTDRGPNLPQPVDPESYAPVNIGSFYRCEDVQSYLVSWGIDMRYHQINYETTPSIWNPEDWVPWIMSAIFVSVEVYLCSFLVLIQTLINLAEYLLNNGLNYGNWMVNSSGNWLTATWTTAGDWLTWAAAAVFEFAGLPDQVLEDWLLNLVTWIPGVNPILSLALAIVESALADSGNLSKGIVGQTLDTIIGDLYNGSLVPYLEYILILLSATGPLALINVIPEFWALLWAVIEYLWVNVFQTINIPLSFYSGLSDGVQSTAFTSLIACDGSELNFWCNMFAALDLLNGIAGHSIFYPIVIVGVIIGTIIILYRNMLALWNFYADWITRI